MAPLLAILVLLAACASSEPTRFYALTPLTTEAPVAETELVLGVAPISLASYLDRAGIVTRASPNELGVSSLHNWIEPLDTQTRRVVARNLAVLLGTDRVFVLPEQRLMPLDYVVEIAIERFDIVASAVDPDAWPPADGPPQTAILEARWTLFAGDRREMADTAPVRIAVPVVEPASYEHRVAAMSDALGRLSRTVATRIASERRPRPATG